MAKAGNKRLFFVINTNSGNNSTDWTSLIENYFANSDAEIELYVLAKNCNLQTIKDTIKSFAPHQVIAVGGDGTVKLVAECLLKTNVPLGILPAGSANGLAKELKIPEDPQKALDVIVQGEVLKIHTTTVNSQLCIHLSDIGLNAYLMKRFENNGVRGMWGYMMASIKVLLQNSPMNVEMLIDDEKIKVNARMIVIANATMYGTGALINPIGRLDDKFFEVIVIKKLSILEIFKMVFTHDNYDEEKTQVYQTNALTMKSRKKVHFQIDGEYLGKINAVEAIIEPNALRIIVPSV